MDSVVLRRAIVSPNALLTSVSCNMEIPRKQSKVLTSVSSIVVCVQKKEKLTLRRSAWIVKRTFRKHEMVTENIIANQTFESNLMKNYKLLNINTLRHISALTLAESATVRR